MTTATAQRSVRLLGKTSAEINRTGAASGELFYDTTAQSLRLFSGQSSVTLATREWVTANAPSANLTGYATQTYVNNQINALVNSNAQTLAALQDITNSLSSQTTEGAILAEIATKADTAALSAVAFSGSYLSLTNRPTLFNGNYNSLTNKPTIFSGRYADLTNKPTIPNDTSQLTNGAGYAILPSQTGNSGKYLTTNGSTVSWVAIVGGGGAETDPVFLAHAAHNVTTTKISNWDTAYSWGNHATAGYLTGTISYTSLSNKPTLFSGSYADLTNKPTLFSGSYADLTNKPTIPSLTGYATESYVTTAVSNLVDAAPSTLDTLNELAAALGDDANYAATITTALGTKANTSSLATVATSGSYTDLTSKPTLFDGAYSSLSGKPTIPTQYTDALARSALSAGTGISYNSSTGAISSSITQYTDALARAALSTAAGSGAYNSSTGVITIPTNTSHLTNGAGFITSTGIPSQSGNSGKYLTTDGTSVSWGTVSGGGGGGGTTTNALEVTTGLQLSDELIYTLQSPTPNTGQVNYSYTTAVNTNWIIVGAYGNSSGGSVYLYNRSTGALNYTINNPNAYSTVSSDLFGISMAVDGNILVVGATGEDDAGGSGSGKVYVFDLSTLSGYSGTPITVSTAQVTINNPTAFGTSASDEFGGKVAVSGSYIVVGAAYEDDTGQASSGKAYIFNTSGTLLYTLSNPNAYSTAGGDLFGLSVAISGTKVAVGSNESSASAYSEGKVYVYDISLFPASPATIAAPGVYGFTVSPPTQISYGQFGKEVALTGNYLLASHIADTSGLQSGSSAGAVYVFNATTGAQIYKLKSPSIGQISRFGESIAVSGTLAVIGEFYSPVNFQSGAAYVFDLTTGYVKRQFLNPNDYGTADSDIFGRSVAIDGTTIVVGAGAEDTSSANNTGRAYVYTINSQFDGSQTGARLSLQKVLPNISAAGGVSGNTATIPVIVSDVFGRITYLSTTTFTPSGLSNAFTGIYVNGSYAADSSGSDVINFVGSGATTVSYSLNQNSYKTITISSTASSGGGASTGWYSMIATTNGTTLLPKPTSYDATMTNMANPKLFVGGEDSNNPSGNQPSSGNWMSNSGMSTFSTYSNNDYGSGYTNSTIDFANTSSGGIRFAIAPNWTSSQSGTSYYMPSSYSGSSYNQQSGYMGPMSGTNRALYAILVLDTSGITATAVNCTVHETKSSGGKTYIAISMTEAQIATLASSFTDVCTFSSYVTIRAYSFSSYTM